jgi:membrane-bound metal-dependent hydrolase YbcI (DUF457 family)
VLLGVEHFRIVPHYTASTHFELYDMPYTHSLAASFVWAGLAYAAFRFLPIQRAADKSKTALVMAAAVWSHWFLDFIVHTPDLPLLGNDTLKLGLGLWNHAVAAYLLEAALLLAAVAWYLRHTTARTFAGKYGIVILTAVLLIVNAINMFGPLLNDDVAALSLTALGLYAVFAIAAFWLDKQRQSVRN